MQSEALQNTRLVQTDTAPFLAIMEKVYKITFRAEENRLVKCFFKRKYCKRRKLKLTHHCIDERSEELAVRGGISVESLLG